MTKQNTSQIALAAAALVLGAALLPASASAQVRNPNDGGQVAVAPGAKLDGGSKPAATQTYYGRNADDGGTGPAATQTSAVAPKASATRTLHMQVGTPTPAAPGRSVNDGGPAN